MPWGLGESFTPLSLTGLNSHRHKSAYIPPDPTFLQSEHVGWGKGENMARKEASTVTIPIAKKITGRQTLCYIGTKPHPLEVLF